MKIVRNFALLMLLGFSLSGFVAPINPSGAGCGALLGLMGQISKKTHENRPDRKFTVSVRACDEKIFQTYREVLKELRYKIDNTWVHGPNKWSKSRDFKVKSWRIDAVRDEDEDLEIDCDFREISSYTLPTGNVGAGKKERLLTIYSKFIYFPEDPIYNKEYIHRKVLERLKNSEAEAKALVPTK